MIITGGAGAGKSTVIGALTQWASEILHKSGDDPDMPYVIIKTSLTGAASTLIGGATIHSIMGFDFSNSHRSLTDKQREIRRELMKNTSIIIIDEFSMMKSDLLYRMNLGLQEIKMNTRDFGGCSIFLFGDPLQMRPVRGTYTWEKPKAVSIIKAMVTGMTASGKLLKP